MRIYNEDIDGVRGFRISELTNGETVQIMGHSLEVEDDTLQKWRIAAEILRLMKDRLKDREGIPETEMLSGDLPPGVIGFLTAKDPDTNLSIRLSWLYPEFGQKFYVEMLPKGRIGAWRMANSIEPEEMIRPVDHGFSQRHLWPIAVPLANALALGPDFKMTSKPSAG